MYFTAITLLANGKFQSIHKEPQEEAAPLINYVTEQRNDDVSKAIERWKIDQRELADAKRRIHHLEQKLKSLESKLPKRYRSVKFLSYRSKKRILVRILFHFAITDMNYFIFYFLLMLSVSV